MYSLSIHLINTSPPSIRHINTPYQSIPPNILLTHPISSPVPPYTLHIAYHTAAAAAKAEEDAKHIVNVLTNEIQTLKHRVKELEDANGVLDNYNKVTTISIDTYTTLSMQHARRTLDVYPRHDTSYTSNTSILSLF